MWFDIIKGKSRTAHSKLIIREMRRIIRPHIRELIDGVMENRDNISVAEIRNIIENNKQNHLEVIRRELPNESPLNPTEKGHIRITTYFNAQDFQDNLTKMATAKLLEDGYTKKQTRINDVIGIYYFKPENNTGEENV